MFVALLVELLFALDKEVLERWGPTEPKELEKLLEVLFVPEDDDDGRCVKKEDVAEEICVELRAEDEDDDLRVEDFWDEERLVNEDRLELAENRPVDEPRAEDDDPTEEDLIPVQSPQPTWHPLPASQYCFLIPHHPYCEQQYPGAHLSRPLLGPHLSYEVPGAVEGTEPEDTAGDEELVHVP
jgi:hypothetical protein